MPRRTTIISLVLTLALAAGWATYIAWLDAQGGPLGRVTVTQQFSPGPGGVSTARIVVRPGAARPTAAVIARQRMKMRGGQRCCTATWNGRDGDGDIVPDGHYRVRIALSDGRTLTLPTFITVDTVPPRVRQISTASKLKGDMMVVQQRVRANENIGKAAVVDACGSAGTGVRISAIWRTPTKDIDHRAFATLPAGCGTPRARWTFFDLSGNATQVWLAHTATPQQVVAP